MGEMLILVVFGKTTLVCSHFVGVEFQKKEKKSTLTF